MPGISHFRTRRQFNEQIFLRMPLPLSKRRLIIGEDNQPGAVLSDGPNEVERFVAMAGGEDAAEVAIPGRCFRQQDGAVSRNLSSAPSMGLIPDARATSRNRMAPYRPFVSVSARCHCLACAPSGKALPVTELLHGRIRINEDVQMDKRRRHGGRRPQWCLPYRMMLSPKRVLSSVEDTRQLLRAGSTLMNRSDD